MFPIRHRPLNRISAIKEKQTWSIGCFHDRPGTISGYEFLLWHGPTFISLDIRDLEILNSSKGLGQAGLISLIVLRIPILPKNTIVQETPKRGSPMARRISFLE
jgi:hypothetical protein